MFRLIIVITLVVGGIFAGMIVLGLLAGAATPTGEQVIFTQPRLDQWTKIALLDLKRNVAVNRYLPIQVGLTQWSSDGERLLVSGARNDRSRMYALGYSREDRQNQWLSTLPRDGSLNVSYSPDQRWYTVPTKVEDGLDIEIRSVQHSETYEFFEPYMPATNAKPLWMLGPTLWTADSQTLIYSKTRFETRAHNFATQSQNFYYRVDVETGEKQPFLDENIYELELSPNSQYVFYSTLKKNNLPSLYENDYQTSFSYYIYNLKNDQQWHVADSPLQGRVWSADGKRLVYQHATQPQQVAQSQNIVERVLVNPWYYDFNVYNAFGSYYPPASIYQGGFSMQLLPRYPRGMPGNQQPMQTYLLDLETGEQRRIVGDEFGGVYDTWGLFDGNTLLFSVQRFGIQALVSQLLNIPYYGNPIIQTYVARLGEDDPAPQLLKYGNKPLGVQQIAPHGSQIILIEMVASSNLYGSSQTSTVYLYHTDTGELREIDLQGELYMFTNWSSDESQTVITTISNQGQSVTSISPYPTLIPGAGSLPTTAPLILPMMTPTHGIQPVLRFGITQPPPLPTYKLYLVDQTSGELRLLATTYEPNTLSWSPDGRSAMYVDLVPGGARTLYFIEDVTAPKLSIRPIYVGKNTNFAYGGAYPIWRPG